MRFRLATMFAVVLVVSGFDTQATEMPSIKMSKSQTAETYIQSNEHLNKYSEDGRNLFLKEFDDKYFTKTLELKSCKNEEFMTWFSTLVTAINKDMKSMIYSQVMSNFSEQELATMYMSAFARINELQISGMSEENKSPEEIANIRNTKLHLAEDKKERKELYDYPNSNLAKKEAAFIDSVKSERFYYLAIGTKGNTENFLKQNRKPKCLESAQSFDAKEYYLKQTQPSN